MVVMLNGVRSLRRYRLVIAQKSKLRLTQEVTAALVSHSREHRLTASGFFRAQLIGVPVCALAFVAVCFLQWISSPRPFF